MLRALSYLRLTSIVDSGLRSAVIQTLHPAIFTLLKATEPWSDEYYVMDIEKTMQEEGFRDTYTAETAPRHRCVMGIAA